jgi:hypothetical protein
MRKILMGIFLIGLAGCGSYSGYYSGNCYKETAWYFYGRLHLQINVFCPYEEKCGKFSFFYSALDEAFSQIQGRCPIDSYNYLLEVNDTIDVVSSNSLFYYSIPANEKIQFTLKDSANSERKYSVDLSEMIHSFEKKGDSIYVKVPQDCHFVFESKKDSLTRIPSVTNDNLENGMFRFSTSDEYFPYYSITCFRTGEDSAKADPVETTVYVGWKRFGGLSL